MTRENGTGTKRPSRTGPLRTRVPTPVQPGESVSPASPVRAVGRGLQRVQHQVGERLPAISMRRNSVRRSTSQQVEGLSPEAALYASRNFRYGVFNGIMFTLVDSLIAPSLVLAWFITRLGAPNVLVGLLPALLTGGWFLPQMLVASRVQGLVRVMHWYRRVGILRTICMGLLCVATVALAGQPALLLIAFFFFYIIYAFSAGISGIPWLEMVGKVIAPRRRGSFFGLRNFWGGVLALLAAVPIGAVLSEQFWGLVFPYNFALLFAFTTLIVGLGIGSWSTIREPDATVRAPSVTLSSLFRRGLQAVREDRDYRAFMFARILVSLATIADPFYVVYAKDNLGAPPATVGLYLGSLSVASLLSNFLWSPLADRAGNRMLMVFTVLSVSLVPLTALLVSLLTGVVPPGYLFSVFAVVFVLSGLALGASRIVNNNMLLAIAPPAERATYIGFLNTMLGVVIFVPVLGGILADLAGFQVLFSVSFAVAIAALAAVRNMSSRPAAR